MCEEKEETKEIKYNVFCKSQPSKGSLKLITHMVHSASYTLSLLNNQVYSVVLLLYGIQGVTDFSLLLSSQYVLFSAC